MDKNTKDQFEFAEFFGAMTLLKILLDANKKSLKDNTPGSKMLKEWLTKLYYEKLSDSMVQYQKLMESLKQKFREISEDDRCD